MSKKVLITGGAGFIGLHLAQRLLQDNIRVDLVDNFKRAVNDQMLNDILIDERANFKNINLLNHNDLNKISTDYDSIFHLAAIIGVVHVLERPYEVLYDNIQLLSNVINIAKKQKKLERFLFASTSEVYAGTLEKFELPIPTPEHVPLALTELDQPRSSYMLSKIYGEALCQQSGLPFTIFRPHNLYGPRMGMAHIIPEQLFKAYEKDNGDSIDVFSIDHTRSFCYIDDAVEMLFRIMKTDSCEGKTLNIGSQGNEISIKEVARLCHLAADKELNINPKSPTKGSPARRNPDMSLVLELIDYQANINLKEGIGLTYSWYKKNVFENEGLTAL